MHIVDIIDDDYAVRESTRALLESYGYLVREFPSAKAFLSHTETRAACLLVDHHMPDLTGLDLLERLHANGDRTPALVITGRSDEGIVLRAARIGVKVVPKPLDENELVGWIEQVRNTGHSTLRDGRQTDRPSPSD